MVKDTCLQRLLAVQKLQSLRERLQSADRLLEHTCKQTSKTNKKTVHHKQETNTWSTDMQSTLHNDSNDIKIAQNGYITEKI